MRDTLAMIIFRVLGGKSLEELRLIYTFAVNLHLR